MVVVAQHHFLVLEQKARRYLPQPVAVAAVVLL
jgi:hypothetical protein